MEEGGGRREPTAVETPCHLWCHFATRWPPIGRVTQPQWCRPCAADRLCHPPVAGASIQTPVQLLTRSHWPYPMIEPLTLDRGSSHKTGSNEPFPGSAIPQRAVNGRNGDALDQTAMRSMRAPEGPDRDARWLGVMVV